ncbi:RNA methyltransferase family protein [Perilla frutescens var. hirtella]|uniref:RNA methyltransferase family protein n=1 Tax=Perilla frutescens var. hirtella TaxID=608512 RepID=A0AAD4JC75_PERFH|nr:RNA methyltransferase family protein [Perilla frutescens var. hirtella]
MAAAAAAVPSGGVHLLYPRPWFRNLRSTARSLSVIAESSRIHHAEELSSTAETPEPPTTTITVKNAAPYYPKRGQMVELVCESLAYKGKGLCKVDGTGFIVMCDRALPGEKFIGRVTRKKDNYAEVKKVKSISPHWDLVEAPCEYASHCGGCKTQDLLYEAQVRSKEQQVRELIVHVGKFSNKDLEYHGIMKPIVPCDIQFHYRNKMEFSFGTKRWVPEELLQQEFHEPNIYPLGLHAPGFFDKVLNVNKCLLQSDPANKVLAAIQDIWRNPEFSLSPYDVHSHLGFLKHLMLRTGRNVDTGQPELMVNFVTSSYQPELLKPLVDKISTFPNVVSIMNNVNTSVGNTSVGEQEHTLFGKPTIMESLRGLKFQISANSFFQTNTHQAEILYKLIEDCYCLKGDGSEIVLDLFCGTGTIGLTLAKKAKHVYGFEIVDQAVTDARRNANLNGICNATFVQGDLNKIGDNFGEYFPKPDLVITDPNRPGMHMKLIKFLLNLKAARIVYVSCNPATCARDLDYLCHGVPDKNMEGCYKLKSIQPVDMFPHTPHIECVCLLELQ